MATKTNQNQSNITSQPQLIFDLTPSEKVIEIFESQYTEQLTDRKANAIIKFCRERKGGFFYQELGNLIKMVNYAIQDLNAGILEMNQSLKFICECAALPFKKIRASDELEYVPLLSQFLTSFKPLLITSQMTFQENEGEGLTGNILPQLRFSVIKFLKNYCEEGIDEILKMEESLEDSQKSQMFEASPLQRLLLSGTKNLRSLDKSDLVEDIIFTMQYYSKNYEFLLPLLDLISTCVLYKSLAQKFSNFGILKDIIYVIFDCEDFRSYIVKSCFEIIWNSFEAVGLNSIKLFATEDIIGSLKKLFENIMKNGYKLEDKCLRNELLILINYLLNDEKALYYFYEKQNVPSVQSPAAFLDILLFYSTIDEMTFYNEPIRTNNLRAFFGTTSEDLEFKKLIWSGALTAIQSNQPQILEAVKNSPFIISLLLYIDPLANSYAVNRWSAPQLREIQLHCLSILSNTILYMKDDFDEKNGLFCLTKFLTNNSDPERREKCLRAFNNASYFDETYKLKITEEGVLDNLIDLLQHENENPIEIKELCFSIISNLCKDCNKNKRLFRQKGGIDLIVNNLKDPAITTSARYALYTVAILDCSWSSILGNKKSETVFLDNEGMYVLLEFLETCDEVHKKMALSCLSYLIENPKSVPYFCDWNSSKTMINATQLLIKIYEKEDIKNGVKYDDGIIVSHNWPLNPKAKQILYKEIAAASPEEKKFKKTLFKDFENKVVDTTAMKKMTGGNFKGFQRLKEALKAGDFSDSDAGTEAYLVKKIKEKAEEFDLRAIVFCILYRTGFDRNELMPNEKQKIEVIQMYPHFKIGEIWSDIKYQLEDENIKATSDDYHWMMTSIEEFQEMVFNVINTQTLIAREYKLIQEEELNKFYEIIKSNKLGK